MNNILHKLINLQNKIFLSNIQYNFTRIILFFSSKKNTPPIKSIDIRIGERKRFHRRFHLDLWLTEPSWIFSTLILSSYPPLFWTYVTRKRKLRNERSSVSDFYRPRCNSLDTVTAIFVTSPVSRSEFRTRSFSLRNDSRFESEISSYPKKKWYNIGEIELDEFSWKRIGRNFKFSPFMDALRSFQWNYDLKIDVALKSGKFSREKYILCDFFNILFNSMYELKMLCIFFLLQILFSLVRFIFHILYFMG